MRDFKKSAHDPQDERRGENTIKQNRDLARTKCMRGRWPWQGALLFWALFSISGCSSSSSDPQPGDAGSGDSPRRRDLARPFEAGVDSSPQDLKIQPPDVSGLPDGYGPFESCPTAGALCQSADPCAILPVCGADLLCRPTRLQQCDDGLSCTQDICQGQGLCEHQILEGSCLIAQLRGGTLEKSCVAKGTDNPSNSCLTCDPDRDAHDWSSKNGSGCDDLDPCTKTDYCLEGVCQGTYYGELCDDGLSCTLDACDGLGGCESVVVDSTACLIDGVCYQEEVADSTGCNICDPAASQTVWTKLEPRCEIGGLCYPKGAKSSTACEICDPTLNPSGWTVLSNQCLISGACYSHQALHASGCLLCDTTVSNEAWSPVSGVQSKSYTFEGSTPLTGWTISNSSSPVGWVASTRKPKNGTHSLYYGNPATGNYDSGGTNSGTATMPAITLPASQKAALAFWLWMDVESSSTYDRLDVKVDTATLWSKTSSFPMKEWRHIIVDISAYAGQTINLQLVFDTGDSVGNTTEGVYVDDVIIYYGC